MRVKAHMSFYRNNAPSRSVLVIAAVLLAACSGSPTAPNTPVPGLSAPIAPTSTRQLFQEDLGGGITLEYEVERKVSGVSSSACYGFLSGTVHNDSQTSLSKRSVLDFIVISGGEVLFRDITNLVTDIPPQGSAMFELIASPVHRGTCPVYDRIEVSLRRVDVGR